MGFQSVDHRPTTFVTVCNQRQVNMVCLKLQKRLAASIMTCGRRKVWIDPNERSEVAMANTRVMIRKLIRDGFIIKKPKKIHSRFRARRRAVEKKRGRHLGLGSRKGCANARNPVKLLWMKRQRALRRLLKRYYESGKIDRKMYHRYYLRAKGATFKNKAALIERVDHELMEKKRSAQLLEQYKVRREEALQRKKEKEERRAKLLDEQLKLAEEAEQIRLQQEREAKGGQTQKGKKKKKGKKQKEESPEPDSGGKKRRRRRKKGGNDEPEPEPEQESKGKRKRRGKKKGSEAEPAAESQGKKKKK